MRRPAVKMAAAMMPAAEMVAMTTAMMTATTMMATAMTAAAVAASMTTATSRDGKVRHTQRRREDNRCNSQSRIFDMARPIMVAVPLSLRRELDGDADER